MSSKTQGDDTLDKLQRDTLDYFLKETNPQRAGAGQHARGRTVKHCRRWAYDCIIDLTFALAQNL